MSVQLRSRRLGKFNPAKVGQNCLAAFLMIFFLTSEALHSFIVAVISAAYAHIK